MVEQRLCQSPVQSEEVIAVKRHLRDYTMTRHYLKPYEEEFESSRTIGEILDVVELLEGEALEHTVKALVRWSKPPKRRVGEYVSSAASEGLIGEFARRGYFELDNSS